MGAIIGVVALLLLLIVMATVVVLQVRNVGAKSEAATAKVLRVKQKSKKQDKEFAWSSTDLGAPMLDFKQHSRYLHKPDLLSSSQYHEFKHHQLSPNLDVLPNKQLSTFSSSVSKKRI